MYSSFMVHAINIRLSKAFIFTPVFFSVNLANEIVLPVGYTGEVMEV